MGKRYGRNQKRKHLQEIKELQERERELERESLKNYMDCLAAKDDAFQDFLKAHHLIDDAIKEISYELGRSLGPELKPYAEKLFLSTKRMMEPVKFRIDDDILDFGNKAITGSIPSFHCQVVIHGDAWRHS